MTRQTHLKTVIDTAPLTVHLIRTGRGQTAFKFEARTKKHVTEKELKRIIKRLMTFVYPQGKYYEKNKQAILARLREYYETNRDTINEKRRAWYQLNKDRINAERRAKNKGSPALEKLQSVL